MEKLTCIYFSATTTTRKCCDIVTQALGLPISSSINLADNISPTLPDFSENDVVIFAMPVYGGRIPDLAAQTLKQINGNGATAIAMVVYGNRDYDDALLELTDYLSENNFCILASAAFIGQHSIFPKVGSGRPDSSDIEKLSQFGKECLARLKKGKPYFTQTPKGQKPYKVYGGVPLHPFCDARKCKKCGICVLKCPVGAIDSDDPTKTDITKCISCGRCIYVCNQKARQYKGLKYNLIGTIFKASFSKRKEPDWQISE